MHVEPSSLLTTREMFYMMGIQGYAIKYYRIPVIENHPPSIVILLLCLVIHRRVYPKLWVF